MLSAVRPVLSSSPLHLSPEWVGALFTHYNRVWVGFSGGVDSYVLLHALVCNVTPEQKQKIAAIHVHHGLSKHADEWLSYCQSKCVELEVAYLSEKVVLDQTSSIEEAARNARYHVFQGLVKSNDVLLLGHHADDQTETVLFRLLRGTGGKGLSGIPQQRPLAHCQGTLIRPLLAVPKKDIERYANHHNLSWIQDESNTDERFSRNFLRQQVIPVLKARFPKMEQRVASTAQKVATDYAMLAEFANQQLDQWCNEYDGFPLHCIAEKTYEERLFWWRYFLLRKGVSLPQAQLDSVDGMFLSDEDKQPEFAFSQGRLMRHQNVLYLLPPDQPVMLGLLAEKVGMERPFDHIMVSYTQVQNDQDCELKGRPQGVSLVMANGSHRKFKKWLNDLQVPSWWRDHLPYVYQGDTLVAIGDLWQHPDWKGNLHWHRSPDLPLVIKSF